MLLTLCFMHICQTLTSAEQVYVIKLCMKAIGGYAEAKETTWPSFWICILGLVRFEHPVHKQMI